MGKMFTSLILLGIGSIWAVGLHAYFTLPDKIPTHFNFEGESDRYGGKVIWLILPPNFSIAPVIFLLLWKYRFVLVNRYPYLINLPAFFTRLDRIPEDERAYWINRYFEVLLALGVALTAYLLVIEYGIYLGTVGGKMPRWFIPFTFLAAILLISGFLIYLRNLSRKFGERIAQSGYYEW